MSKLIVTANCSGAGHLKGSGIADEVLTLTQRLVWGPTQEIVEGLADPEMNALKAARYGLHLTGVPVNEKNFAGGARPENQAHFNLLELIENYDQVELWFDPAANDQLVLLAALAQVAESPVNLDGLFLIHYQDQLGGRELGALATLRAVHNRVRDDQLRLAMNAWQAYIQPDPTAWWQLLNQDLSALPFLRQTVLEMLRELPSVATGLGATEAALLLAIAPGNVAPFDVFPNPVGCDTPDVFNYWEVGQILDWLAGSPEPAILGVAERPFSLALHDAPERYARYSQSRLSLTDFGQRLVGGHDDISHHKPIRRWWGGTRLTNDALWRWDASTGRLVAPN